MFNEYLLKRFIPASQEPEENQESATRKFKISGRGFIPGIGYKKNETTNPRSKEVMEQNRQQQAAITKQVTDKWEEENKQQQATSQEAEEKQESATRKFKISPRVKPGTSYNNKESNSPRSKEVMEQNRQQQVATTKQVADKWEVAVWRDTNIFNSTPAFAQVGITEDMIKSNKVPSNYVAAALKLLHRGYTGDEQNAAVKPNEKQYDSVINAAKDNPQGPLSRKINVYAAALTKVNNKAKKKQHKEFIRNLHSGNYVYDSVDTEKSEVENIQALVKKMDDVYSEYMSTPQNTEASMELEAECDKLFNDIKHRVTNNETSKILIAEAILNLRNGSTPPWLGDSDMEEIKKLLNTQEAYNIRSLIAQGAFANRPEIWKNNITGEHINKQ